jgi:NADH:ubiquinone oxidoreductase subunit E/NAD-dependent dihydropyrimidine dehydrogenase PreA subunit
MKIGVYVCECGINIGATVDVPKVVDEAKNFPKVVVAREYKYMCSDPGQTLIKKDIEELSLDKVVVASCSPRMHEPTFRTMCKEAGLNPFCFEMANIREQCSWVHSDKEKATQKAIALVRAAVARASLLEALQMKEVGITPQALVIGGGIAGIQAALDIADTGFKTYLVERTPSIGGRMSQLDKTFPTLDCSACILTPKMVDVGRHANIELLTYSEIEKVDGYVGNFKVSIRKKARSVDEDKCTGCGECVSHCLVRNRPQLEPVPGDSCGLTDTDLQKLDDIFKLYADEKGVLIPILQDINSSYGYLPGNILRYVSKHLEIPLSQIYNVATFYTAFSLKPRGKHTIKVCQGTACHVRGSRRVLSEIERQLSVVPGGTTDDQQFTLETVNCLGCCAMGPVVMVDEEYHMTPADKVEPLLKKYQHDESRDKGVGA